MSLRPPAPRVPEPVVQRAAAGELPGWACAGTSRRAHMERVAALLDTWALELQLPERDRVRWRALGHLHDALREAPFETLRAELAAPWDALPGPILHGPAAALRLAQEEGVDDAELLDAVRWHTLGHAELGPAGLALYAADFLEPGRDLENEWRDRLRARMPGDLHGVVREIVQGRILHLVGRGSAVAPETCAFWNRLAGGETWGD